MDKVEAMEKGQLLKDALTIVNELAKLDFEVIDGDPSTAEDLDVEKLEKLYIKAKQLKRNRWWDVPNNRLI